MGSSSMVSNRNEKIITQVRLESAFWMSKYEVTQEQWMAVMNSNPSTYKACAPDCPVQNVSWIDVQEFVRRLNSREGTSRYRLPTEAQWEYAVRAGTPTDTPVGNFDYSSHDAHLLDSIAWNGGTNGPHAVGKKEPNALGFHDMLGNVWDWMSDWYADYPSGITEAAWATIFGETTYGASPYYRRTNPTGPKSGVYRVVCGCGSNADNRDCRSAYRAKLSPVCFNDDLGFRLLRTD